MKKQPRGRGRSQAVLLAVILVLCAIYLWSEAAPQAFTRLMDRVAEALPGIPLGKIHPLDDGFFYASNDHVDSFFERIEISVERGATYEARFWRSDAGVRMRALPSSCAPMTKPRSWSADRYGPVEYRVNERSCMIAFAVDNRGDHGWAIRVDEAGKS